ncbi:FAD:protein FMN transferase [Kosakonia sp. H02]|nr:FAD:protein FMN transferase [Kosakonia sp. H02]
MKRSMWVGLLMWLSGTTAAAQPHQQWESGGKIMGTWYQVKVAHANNRALAGLQGEIDRGLAGDNALLSTWQPDSTLSRFNRYAGTDPQAVPAGMARAVRVALQVAARTGGAMDITVGPLVNLWGFGPGGIPANTPDVTTLAEAQKRVGWWHLHLSERHGQSWMQKDLPSLSVDLSTVGEGYAADHLAALMAHRGINNYLVSVGGAVVTRGVSASGQPWKVAIQQPTDQQTRVEAVVDLQGHGISTAGSYRNYYQRQGRRLSHIIDPASGQPVTHHLVSATVIAASALQADAWDTGLMVLGPQRAKQLAVSEGLAVYLIIATDQGFISWASPAFAGYLISSTAH